MENIAPALLEWFYKNQRILPFRTDPSPYHVWLSEIMLQQTRVEAVKSYYQRFLEALPDVKALAEAEEDQLLKLWEGLGYYNRVRNIQKAAIRIVKEYGGRLPADYEKLKAEFDDLLETDRCTHSMEYRWLDLKKKPIWIHCKGYLVRDDNMKPLYMIGCVNEIGKRQKADNVSGLLGESGFREYMNQLDTPLETGYLLRIGIDHFKEINDNFGQEYGDFVLRKTADCISGCLSEGQKVYKLVADEFLIMDVSSDEVRDAEKLYNKMREEIGRFIEANEFKVMYTVSGGIVPFGTLGGDQYSEALKLTDFALNEAKTLGRNRCYIFDGETYRKFLRKREITQELREAVLNGCQGFTAFYQPVFDEDKKVPYGAEALMRFTSEKLGMISPAEFIPILEETGLIIPAGRWMMREAMGKCSEIRKVLPGFRVSINISQVQASNSDVIQDISAETKRARNLFIRVCSRRPSM